MITAERSKHRISMTPNTVACPSLAPQERPAQISSLFQPPVALSPCVRVLLEQKVRAPQDLMRYIVPKGFISVDGTSLTVCEVNYEECWFSFMLVAYTQVNGGVVESRQDLP